MKKQGFNPFLPSYEYIPDGEPHVFGDRVYLYGSHDAFNGYNYCPNDYVCYSADVKDLKDWRFEGTIYRRDQDPLNKDRAKCMFAPDVTQGADGRYYLYYALNAVSRISVAVCDTPAGEYEFYGYVQHANGDIYGEKAGDELQFDPGVLFEDGKTYLYTGFCPADEKERFGSRCVILKEDMLTIAEGPFDIAPGVANAKGTSFEGREFFEASSIRKVKDTYYFIYSSVYNVDLTYATSSSPTGPFTCRGAIVCNNDKGIDTYKDAARLIGPRDNNHGSICELNGEFYIFYHRHTNGHGYSRQACMEKITIKEDGSIPQVEVTSCGSNGGPLDGEGYYPGYICCGALTKAIWDADDNFPSRRRPEYFPFVTQDKPDGEECEGYLANLDKNAIAIFRYFDCKNTMMTMIKTRGFFDGKLDILTDPDGEVCGSVKVGMSDEWAVRETDIKLPDGVNAIYIRPSGIGAVSIAGFELKSN